MVSTAAVAAAEHEAAAADLRMQIDWVQRVPRGETDVLQQWRSDVHTGLIRRRCGRRLSHDILRSTLRIVVVVRSTKSKQEVESGSSGSEIHPAPWLRTTIDRLRHVMSSDAVAAMEPALLRPPAPGPAESKRYATFKERRQMVKEERLARARSDVVDPWFNRKVSPCCYSSHSSILY